MSLLKYFGYQSGDGDDHGGRLFWSGHLEAPFRGRQAPLLTKDEYEKLEINYDFKSDTFDMAVPEQKARFIETMDRVANGWYVLHHIMRKWDEETGAVKIYVEWLQKYSDLPPHLRNNGAIL